MFRTELNPKDSREKINITSPIFTIGSCFSDAMGLKFEQNKFRVLANPFGTVYNPISIIRLMERSITKDLPGEAGFVHTQGLWAHYDFHSKFSAIGQEQLRTNIKATIQEAHDFLKRADYLLVTLGTALVYTLKTSNEIVSNCHKVPATMFEKVMLEEAHIINAFTSFIKTLKTFNPSLKVIVTVSPVRHIKDTLEINMVSKAILRTACYKLERDHDNLHYFPSYELMMDDLRDYRFYKSDMIHPNEDAEEYIWNKFTATYCDQETLFFMEKWSAILKAINHKPFNKASENHQRFVQKTIKQLEELSNKFDITKELGLLKAQLL